MSLINDIYFRAVTTQGVEVRYPLRGKIAPNKRGSLTIGLDKALFKGVGPPTADTQCYRLIEHKGLKGRAWLELCFIEGKEDRLPLMVRLI